jgi:2-octaprenyl-6-methoxyphenol hydroxylase
VRAEFDCVIVGGGLVGTTAAVLLGKRGLSVAVLERRAKPTNATLNTDVRALVLAPASFRILEEAGLWSALTPLAEPIRHIRVQQRGRFGSVRLNADDAGLTALGYACPGDGLLQAQVAAAEAALGDAFHWATSYVSHTSGSDRVTVSAESNGQTFHFESRLLIAADGAESDVRRIANIDVERFDYQQQAIVSNLDTSAPLAHTAFERFTSAGPLALIPRGGASYVAVQVLDDESAMHAIAQPNDDYLKDLEIRFGGQLGTFSNLGPRHRHALVRRRALHIIAPRVALIGNAANTVHPNAAQGLNLGLRDAYALSQSIADRDPGAIETLERYVAYRTRDHASTLRTTDLLAQAFRSPLAAVACARGAAMAATAYVSPLRRRLIVEASGLGALARMHR